MFANGSRGFSSAAGRVHSNTENLNSCGTSPFWGGLPVYPYPYPFPFPLYPFGGGVTLISLPLPLPLPLPLYPFGWGVTLIPLPLPFTLIPFWGGLPLYPYPYPYPASLLPRLPSLSLSRAALLSLLHSCPIKAWWMVVASR